MKKVLLLLVALSLILVACSSSEESAAEGQTSCGDPILDSQTKTEVEVQTTLGNFTIELDTQEAPVSSAHFAARVQEGFYDGLIFHRVVPDFVIQGGDPDGVGTGSYDCKVVSEEPLQTYSVGDVAWAKVGDEPAGTAGSQFFVITGNNPLPPEYGYIGKVTSGLEVTQQIEQVERTEDDKPVEDVVMNKLEIKS